MEELLNVYLENISAKAARLGIPRQTLYSWKSHPHRADLDRIEQGLVGLLRMVQAEQEKRVRMTNEVTNKSAENPAN